MKLLCFSLLLAITLPGVATLQGDHSPFTQFSIELPVFPQNYTIARDNRAYVYVGNYEGVVLYDGENWSLTPLANGDIVRALRHDGNNRIYAGGYDQFGYLELNDTGLAVFTDLTPLFEDLLQGEDFDDIWDIKVSDHGIYFSALNHLFFYEPESKTVELWRHDGRFGAMVEIDGRFHIQFRGEGLRYRDGDNWVLVPGSEPLDQLVYGFLPVSEDTFLIYGGERKWQTYGPAGVTDIIMPAEFPDSERFVTGGVTDDGTLVMATQTGEVYFFHYDSKQYQSVKVATGFVSDMVVGDDGMVLTISDDGFAAIRYPSSWTLIDADSNLEGSVSSITSNDGRWYVLTSSGVYQSASPGKFERLSWTGNEAWDLLFLDDGKALLADSYGLILIDGDDVTPISGDDLYPRFVQRSEYNDQLIYVGTEYGLVIYENIDGQWRLTGKQQELGYNLSGLVEISATELLASTDRAGVIKLNFSAADERDLAWRFETKTLGKAEGIEYGPWEDAYLVRDQTGRTVVSTSEGFFIREGDQFVRDDLEGLAMIKDPDDLLLPEWSENGQGWAYTYNKVYRQDEGRWIRQDTKGVRRGAFHMLAFDGDRAIFGGNAALTIFNPKAEKGAQHVYNVTLARVEIEQDDGTLKSLSLKDGLKIPKSSSWVHFSYTLPDLERPDAVKYQTRLMPLEERFSDWSSKSQLSYWEFQPGAYEFQVRAMDSRGNVVESDGYQFSVIPPWYETNEAKILLGLLAALFLGLSIFQLIQYRSRALKEENEHLEHMIAERTRELQSANRQLENMAHLDSLTEIPNRRRLENYLDEVWTQCADHNRELAVAILDVDHFKAYNDQFGHLEGDKLLKELAAVLSRSLRRAEDLAARYGGEEFLLVFPGAGQSIALDVSETIRRRIANSSLGVTVSIGVAVARPASSTSGTDELIAANIKSLLSVADEALYSAKEAGRNQIIIGS